MACDANFRLKLKNRKLADVDLSPGWGYYVPEEPYQRYLKERLNDIEVRSMFIWTGFSSIDDMTA